jgi:hypothetical protein
MKRYWKMELNQADGRLLVLVVATSQVAIETDLAAHPKVSLIQVGRQDEPRETGTQFSDRCKENPDLAHRALASGAFIRCLRDLDLLRDPAPAFNELIDAQPQARPTRWIGVLQIVPVWENPRLTSTPSSTDR